MTGNTPLTALLLRLRFYFAVHVLEPGLGDAEEVLGEL